MSFLFRILGRFLVTLWHALDVARRVFFNLLFLALLAGLGTALYLNRPPHLENRTVLVLDLKGNLVEQHSANMDALMLAGAADDLDRRDTQLRDIWQVLQAAAEDPRISSVLLLQDDLRGAGLPMLHEVANALDRFRAKGKPVIAWGAGYDQRQYYLAAHADALYLDPQGQVLLEGFGHYRNYYRDALDKLGITVHLMRVGTYKSFAEPFTANGPSPAATEADRSLYDALWQSYMTDVEKQRHLPKGNLQQSIDALPRLFMEQHGDAARLALQLHWVDALKTRQELKEVMLSKGAPDDQEKTFRQISFEDYLSLQKTAQRGPRIAVVVAEGEIRDGTASAGAIGGLSTARLIRKAREDEQVKAVIVRLNSPGGSVYGSELIRRELELTRHEGKPVVISMSSLAASGGYWLSLAADEIIADPDTVTGSIGVFALVPSADKLAGKLGIHTGGTTTTWLGDANNPLRPLDPRFEALLQRNVDHIYEEFTTLAATARKTSPQRIDAVAQGRVWTGQQAKEKGLVDRTGNFNDAVQAAASRAHLEPGYHLHYFDVEPTGWARWLQHLDEAMVRVLSPSIKMTLSTPLQLWREVPLDSLGPLSWWSELSEGHAPFLSVAHCLCQAP